MRSAEVGARISVFAVTRRGMATAERIAQLQDGAQVYKFSAELVREKFRECDALVFVMALGIVVRTIGPILRDKRTDPAVVALDEEGRNVISVLSGHRGANELAKKIADALGGSPVITTATDARGRIGVEALARALALEVEIGSMLKEVNAAIADDRRVGLLIDARSDGSLPKGVVLSENISLCDSQDGFDALIAVTNKVGQRWSVPFAILRPKNLIAGIGAKRGAGTEDVLSAIARAFEDSGFCSKSLAAISTVDLKSKESGITGAASRLGVPLRVVSSAEIIRNEARFAASEVVRKRVGLPAVCEPCAVLAGRGAELVVGKRAYSGVTVAIAEERIWASSS